MSAEGSLTIVFCEDGLSFALACEDTGKALVVKTFCSATLIEIQYFVLKCEGDYIDGIILYDQEEERVFLKLKKQLSINVIAKQ